jgi:AmmeMemoRadiSam system protein B
MNKFLAIIAAALFTVPLGAGTTRPVRDDVGFCWSPASMARLVEYLDAGGENAFSGEELVAAISPHDDYLYAGRVYHPLFKALRAKEVVIFGVTHGAVRKEIGDPRGVLILEGYDAFPGLTGPVGISGLRERIKSRLDRDMFLVNDRAHELEHSIEAILPFLQYYDPEVKITPIMVAPMPYARMEEVSGKLAAVIADYIRDEGLALGRDIAFLISSDGNHYGKDFDNSPFGEGVGAWEKATALDRRLIADHLTGPMNAAKVEGLTKELWGETYIDYRNTYWCGKYSVPFGLLAAEKVTALMTGKGLAGTLFKYSDTYSEGVLPLTKTGMGTTAPFSLRHWVSFCSIGYYLDRR